MARTAFNARLGTSQGRLEAAAADGTPAPSGDYVFVLGDAEAGRFHELASGDHVEVRQAVDLTDADFVHELADGETKPPRGKGPYLGMGEKFCVLLLERKSSLGRYNARFGASPDTAPQAFNYIHADALGFATTSEWFTGTWEHDTALRCHVRWFVGQLLLRGYQGFYFEHSLWLRQGLGHVLSRQVDPKYNTLPRIPDTLDEVFERWDWAPSVRARVGHDLQTPLADMARWDPVGRRTFADHRMAWSRVDWLLRQEPDDVATFFRLAAEPFDTNGQVATQEQVAAHEEAALQAAFQLDYASADEVWAEWVEDEYPRK